MPSMPASRAAADQAARWFSTTHWSVVLAAGVGSGPAAREALENLCRTYWPPLYAYVRRHGHSPEDAEDITQEFFARFLEKEYFQKADPGRGLFRTFLLTALQRFLVSEWRKSTRLKRGGNLAALPVNTAAAEEAYASQAADPMTPEQAYEQRWAMALMDRVLARLRAEYATAGHLPLFGLLKESLWGGKEVAPYAQIGAALGQTEGAVKTAVHRLRQRCGELLREEVAQTVAQPAEIEGELRYLISVLRR
jgi:RNA polymerase sigma factor (sigma-70 family)